MNPAAQTLARRLSVSGDTLSQLEATAADAARDAGRLVADAFDGRPRRADRKGEGDFVTEVDLASERALRERLLGLHPDHGFLGEEEEAVRLDAEFVWVVDPIDGTSNFAQGIDCFGVSVACCSRGVPIAAAVHFPTVPATTYTAALGGGARRDGVALEPADVGLDDASVIGVQWMRGAPADLGLVARCIGSGARIRVFGSTVHQLCDVAAGRLHANIQQQGRIWDIAAAGLIAMESGALVTNLQGAPVFPVTDLGESRHYPTCVARPRMHEALLRKIAATD